MVPPRSESMLDLEGYVALVSGGGTGIGEAIARSFARAGAAVAITGRRGVVLDRAAAAIASEGRRALAIAGDVSRRADCERMVSETVARFGRLDVLVNNAGVSRGGPLGSTSEATVHELVDVDLKGPIFLAQAALGALASSGAERRASILNISSSVTVHPVPNYSVYSAAKAGLDMLTRCWAIELAPARIRVNAILPGIVRTPVFETMLPADAIEKHLARFEQLTPLGRIGSPVDVARLALFLSSPASEWTTGAVIPLDGGLSLVSEAPATS
jgi:NAD(P)-dependent dehydrogenase (short-subunit alcohol dehydrogenase family)